MNNNLKRADLNGCDVIAFRVFENGIFADRVYARDPTQPIGNNCWVQIPYAALAATEPKK